MKNSNLLITIIKCLVYKMYFNNYYFINRIYLYLFHYFCIYSTIGIFLINKINVLTWGLIIKCCHLIIATNCVSCIEGLRIPELSIFSY